MPTLLPRRKIPFGEVYRAASVFQRAANGDPVTYSIDRYTDLFMIDPFTGAIALQRELTESDEIVQVLQVSAYDPLGARDVASVIFSFIQAPNLKHVLPTWKTQAKAERIDMVDEKRAGKSDEEITMLVEAELRAKLKALAGVDTFDKVLFTFGETLHRQQASRADGEFGFVVGWKRDVSVSAPNDDGYVTIDYSKTVIAYFTYVVIYSNDSKPIDLVFSSGDRNEIVKGPKDAEEHERWHTNGPPAAFRQRASDKGILLTRQFMGAYQRLGAARGGVTSDLVALKVQDKAAAENQLNASLEAHFTTKLAEIAAEGFWHEGDLRIYREKFYYEYAGDWQFR